MPEFAYFRTLVLASCINFFCFACLLSCQLSEFGVKGLTLMELFVECRDFILSASNKYHIGKKLYPALQTIRKQLEGWSFYFFISEGMSYGMYYK